MPIIPGLADSLFVPSLSFPDPQRGFGFNQATGRRHALLGPELFRRFAAEHDLALELGIGEELLRARAVRTYSRL